MLENQENNNDINDNIVITNATSEVGYSLVQMIK